MRVMSPPLVRSPADAAVTVRAPGRLHLGFLDPGATLGRRFGSLGLVIEGFETEIELGAAERDLITAGPAAEAAELDRIAVHLRCLRQASGCHQPLRLHLHRSLPPHTGLGSGTQLALAVGRAFAQWFGLPLSTPELATWLGRGLRSGVGIAGFDSGGLLLDGGPGADGQPAPLLSHLALPEAWRVVVVQDPQQRGLHGSDEKSAIATLPPLAQVLAAEICHRVLMQVLPGVASAEFALFASGLNRVQQILGDHFAPAQGGSACTSPAVGRLLQWINAQSPSPSPSPSHSGQPLAATGQSSWGPTAFAIVPDTTSAEALLAAARQAGVLDARLTLRTVCSRNHGARVVDSRRHGSERVF